MRRVQLAIKQGPFPSHLVLLPHRRRQRRRRPNMAAAVPYPPPSTSENDIFSISDAQLAQRYQFLREIGAGNWGCVWLCSPKEQDAESLSREEEAQRRVAVKLVFREKKPTTAQRVRSLWNEMKIVRALKSDPHPSIVPFHSFIITPSFAIITMEYLPHLIPVEVPETKAREWFRCLLSATLFLHSRGVVHNDIKPANILLSKRKIPVLVDFGFAERYDTVSKRAFLSNLAYGTPEYLSPERARGNVHDTRKSDMWSLGITFFEILVGRTPFEYVEGEKFATPEDLERYWSRTVKGKWVGEWKMSKSAERLLKKMVSPNADIRITAKEAMKDPYWTESQIPVSKPIDENDFDKAEKDLRPKASFNGDDVAGKPNKGQIKTLASSRKENEAPTPPPKVPEKRNGKGPVRGPLVRRAPSNLPTIQGSPFKPPTSEAKENNEKQHDRVAIGVDKKHGPATRKPMRSLYDKTASPTKTRNTGGKDKGKDKVNHRKGRVLLDMTDRWNNALPTEPDQPRPKAETTSVSKGSQDRVKAFERLKELERSKFLEEEEDDEEPELKIEDEAQVIEVPRHSSSQLLPTPTTAAMSTTMHDTSATPSSYYSKHLVDSIFSEIRNAAEEKPSLDEASARPPKITSGSFPRSGNGSGMSLLKQGVKTSIDKTLRLYKSSTLGRTSKYSGQERSRISSEEDGALATTRKESWENDSWLRQAKSSLPVVRHALRAEQVAADNKVDRMSMWIRNVEQVVKEAQENFASSSVMPLPALPVRPVHRQNAPRSGRPARMPRKILAADQIFRSDSIDPTSSSFSPSDYVTPDTSRNISEERSPPGDLSQIPTIDTPRRRRATISSMSPKSESKTPNSPNGVTGSSPMKHTEKSNSSGDLYKLVRPISPLDELRKQLEKDESRETPNLSAMLDRSVFFAQSTHIPTLHEVPSIPTIPNITLSPDHSHNRPPFCLPPEEPESPKHLNVLREANSSPTLSSPARRHIEGVYDRFLMATTGVKRVGRGYQSDNTAPMQNLPGVASYKSAGRRLGMGRRAMPPPVSSDDLDRSGFVDDFGNIATDADVHFMQQKDDTTSAMRSVTKAFRAIVTGKSLTRRQSKVM